MTRLRSLSSTVLLGVLLWSGGASCAGSRMPTSGVATRGDRRVPLVLVPGVTGTELRTVDEKQIVWGSGWRLLFPRDRGRAAATSLVDGSSEAQEGDVLEELTLGPIRKPIYGPVNEWLRQLGYREGDLDHPRPDATYFPFAHDWRQSNVTSAAILRDRLEALREVRGEKRLEVDLLCQSNGAHICRYLMKYDGIDPSEAGSSQPRPSAIHVRRLILVGASNGGSLRIFRMLHRGRRHLPLGRLWSPEALFTFVSFFQDLPAQDRGLFLDPAGKPLDVDLYDPKSWVRYGWSVFHPEVRREIEAAERPDLFGDEERRRQYLEDRLRDARRFQRRLAANVEIPGTTIYLVEGAYTQTPVRAVLAPGDSGWQTLFPEDTGDLAPWIRALALAPGDGHATHESQWDLSPAELSAIADDPLHVRAGHFEAILQPETLRQIGEWLAD